jgi:Domain of unknown function (DUF1844)
MSSGDKDSGDTQRGFAVTDRRSFTDSGESRASDPAPGPAPTAPAAPPAEPPAAPEGKSRGRLPPVDFPTFVLSIGSSVLMHLGEAPELSGGEVVKDLALAKHSIDILSMLEQKTKGNLNAAEAQLMEGLLYDLRLRYVEAAKK